VWEQKPVAVLVIALTFPTPGSLTASYASQNVVSRWQQHIAEQVQKFEGVLLPGVPLLHVVAFGLPLALACKHQEHSNQAYALRLLGEIAAHRASSGVDSAAVHYRQALTLANELGMRPLQAHCHYGLGMLYLKTQRQDQARTALSTAIALYHAMEMTFWLPQAEAALAQMEGR
jgi:tetratricopeptide (TPR) repeat protein